MIASLIGNLPLGLCLLLGAGLMIVEMFVPGFGLPGIMGLVFIGAGTVLAGVYHGTMAAVAVLLVTIAVLAVLVSWLMRRASKGELPHGDLFLKEREELHAGQDMQVLVGKKGVTTSVLRPAGIGDFDGVRLNVVTEGGFIERGMPIEIVSVQGARIVVKAIQEA